MATIGAPTEVRCAAMPPLANKQASKAKGISMNTVTITITGEPSGEDRDSLSAATRGRYVKVVQRCHDGCHDTTYTGFLVPTHSGFDLYSTTVVAIKQSWGDVGIFFWSDTWRYGPIEVTLLDGQELS